MASIYPKQRSPFWYIRYTDSLTGKPRDESTKLRRDNTEQTRKARQLCAQHTANELAIPRISRGDGWEWVEAFFVVHYPNELSRQRAISAWFNLSAYMKRSRIASPRLLTRENCMDYLSWRTTSEDGKRLGLRKAKHNTARVELQILSALMREAVIRRKAIANPCLQLGIGRVPGKIKPEITEPQIVVIEERLKAEAGEYEYNEDMQVAWDIAIRYARRLTETAVRLEDIDLDEMTITFRNKGGKNTTKLLHPELIPLFRRLKKEGKEFAHKMWPNWSKIWKYFFKRCGFPDLSHHSIRVTVVNKLRRERVDPRVTRDFVDHSSVIVHRGYERWRPDDHAPAVKALSRRSQASS